MEFPLKIYKASAGSGKTYTLTAEYLKLLFENADDPYAFRKILAVTFTNKATAEMKQRILSELYKISLGEKGSIYDLIKENSALRDDELTRKARIILKNVLEDYSAFKVQTIDSFFQEIVRSFAMEMNRQSAFGIEMDSENVITLSLESLIDRLDGQSESILTLHQWISRIYQENLENESHTSTFEDIKRLANALLFDENNSAIIKSLSSITPSQIGEAKKRLKQIAEEGLQEFINECKGIVSFFAQNGIDPQSSFRKYLSKFGDLLADDETAKLFLEDEKKGFNSSLISIGYEEGPLYAKSASASIKESFDRHETEIREKVRAVIKVHQESQEKVITAGLLLKYIDAVPGMIELIHDIENYRKENNCLIISDINQLLNAIINDSELPFVYEKVGTRINHYMIDEFQDTSPLQWANFKPLLRESLDNGNRNMIVGDVKQSIYRFRGTDSSLLGYKVNKEFGKHVEEEMLEYNWRSEKNIIDFNNAFFEQSYDFERYYKEQFEKELTQKSEDLEAHEDSYKGATQKFPNNRSSDGYVTITELPPARKIEIEDIAASIEEKLVHLQKEQGYSPSDIAFLVRNKAEGMILAELLSTLSEKYSDDHEVSFRFLSDDALLINNSIVVRLLMCLLRCFASPGQEENEKELSLHIERYIRMYRNHLSDNRKALTKARLLNILSYGLTIYESVSKAIEIISFVPEQDETYVSSFLDIIFSFSSQKMGSYSLFVEWWEEHKDKAMVNMGEGQTNSITITTIHKSKGLEYPIVFLPFASWEITKKSSAAPRIVTADVLPPMFGLLPFYIIPTNYSKFAKSYLSSIAETQFEADYTDTLNLLYVAFTRASSELHVYTHTNLKNNSADIITNRLNLINELLPIDTAEDPDTGIITSYYGNETHKNKDIEEEQKGQNELKGLTASPRYEDLLLSRKAYGLSLETEEERRKGIIMHEILSRTKTLKDFEKNIEKEVLLNRLSEEDKKIYTDKFTQAMQHPTIGTWFTVDSSSISLTEQDIMTKAGNYRPDKLIINGDKAVVVDYKFGVHRNQKYRRQVDNYLNLLQSMGYTSPVGYIWYNLENDIDKVTLP
ncbi:exodeoxyribonuclease V subunit beta [Porphyromonas sp.]|uniref:UvrD-helicase domain-containing protein n=1 Tax=Porphyromonas sp. TaxID=1924944 RepID=UPI0026DD2F03|nr:UvrD-helicase domain-containing protein [Porphyromonas sp.]MDO4695560.1 UvrD-helicase domain-containing protein [Porphyromonas sp.]MDO4770516.1 UvrD-helicase domain-containing protein [Porphyromonas sp.]